jgi:glycosyltransferase involved in cell wall biosynthesis
MKTILATTYAVNPLKGSEDGMGWNFVCQIAKFNKVIAITRENNQVDIEKYMLENPDVVYENIEFLYFDLPYWMRFWKKGGRGAMLYYLMWQKGIVSFIQKQKIQFDITHNLNFHNDWSPSYLWKLGKPFVWGPIGHHPEIPKQYLQNFKKSYYIKDKMTWAVKKMFWNLSPALKNTVKNADHIWCMNGSVAEVLNLKNKKYSVSASVATADFGFNLKKKQEEFTLVSAGRFVPLKGFDLTILSFAKFLKTLSNEKKKKCKLQLVGSGPELSYLKQLCQEKNISQQVEFIDWIAREELMKLFKESTAFIFPSHEGAGMVVPEALSFGLPVICIDNCGPGSFVNDETAYKISIQNFNDTVTHLSAAILDLYSNPEKQKMMSKNARDLFESDFHWDRRGEKLNEIYSTL